MLQRWEEDPPLSSWAEAMMETSIRSSQPRNVNGLTNMEHLRLKLCQH